MKRRPLRILAALLALLLTLPTVFSLTSCEEPPAPPAETTAPPVTIPPPEPELTVEGGVYHYDPPTIPVTAEVPLSDVSEHPEWREPLLALLKTFYAYSTHVPADPDKPLSDENFDVVLGAYYVGLLDVNLDGIPEVAREHGLRGSSGLISIHLYDLYTGEELGYVDGDGWTLAVSKTGEYRYYTTSYNRVGDAHEEVEYQLIDGTQNEHGRYLTEGVSVRHDYDERWREHGDTFYRTDLGYTFYHGGGTASLETVDAYFRALESDWRLVEGTEMRYVAYHELDVYKDDPPQEVLAEAMANELLKAGQRFLAFPPETGESTS